MSIFVVVARSRADLYQYFAKGFAGLEGVTVILDRRLGPDDPPATGLAGPSTEHRRTPRDIYDELESRGFVIVRLPG